LREESGIEVKSASSTIEEVVAASFVERQARERNLTLPGKSQWFGETAKAPAKKGGKAAKGAAPEPATPAPTLRPRLIKTVKPVEEVEAEPAAEAPEPVETSEPEAVAAAPAPAETPAEPAAR